MTAQALRPAEHGEGTTFTLDNGTELTVLHWGDKIRIINHSRGRPNTSGLSVRVHRSNEITVSEAR